MKPRYERDSALDEVVGGVWLPKGEGYPKTFLEQDTPEPTAKGPNILERHKVAATAVGAAAVFVAGVIIRGVKEAVSEPQTA